METSGFLDALINIELLANFSSCKKTNKQTKNSRAVNEELILDPKELRISPLGLMY